MASHNPIVPGLGRSEAKPVRRNWRTGLMVWWREIDLYTLFLVLALMVVGTMAVAAASPASAGRLSTSAEKLDHLHFFWLHVKWQMLGLMVMIGASFFTKDTARRLGIILAACMVVGLMLVPFAGVEVNGARRWLSFGITFQPSEFLKPAFAIVMAWILSWRMRDSEMPAMAISIGFMGIVGLLLMVQPDFGATVLFAGVCGVLLFLAGLDMRRIGYVLGVLVVCVVLAYLFYDNGRQRIDAFLGGGSAYDQVYLAQRTLRAGGWLGSGIWMGTRKNSLPEAHTDYIFSVVGEEFGLLFCALIVLLYFALIARVFLRLVKEDDVFTILAAAGLVTQIGGQAFINIFVNLQIVPSKGMTLPFISYGGSSTVALCLTVGLLLAITRRNPYLNNADYVPHEHGGLK